MNQDIPESVEHPASAEQPAKLPIVFGFVVGAAPWLIACIPQKNYGSIPYLVFACFGMPIISIITAIVPKSRRFGLGLLLATGLGWLILGAMCSGVFR